MTNFVRVAGTADVAPGAGIVASVNGWQRRKREPRGDSWSWLTSCELQERLMWLRVPES